MSKFWRVVAPVVAAGGLVAAGAIPAASASPTVTSTYTINVEPNRHFPKISGHTLVIYKTKGFQDGEHQRHRIWGCHRRRRDLVVQAVRRQRVRRHDQHGDADATARCRRVDVLLLGNAEPGHRLRGASDHPGATVDVTSTPVTVYVTEGGTLTNKHNRCSRTSCTFSYKITEFLPASAYKTETHKQFYLYLAVGLPEDSGQVHPRQGRHGIQDQEDQLRRVRGDLHLACCAPSWRGELDHHVCTKDSESKDGMGLPGTHSCGNRHISRKVRYIG